MKFVFHIVFLKNYYFNNKLHSISNNNETNLELSFTNLLVAF